MSISALEKFFSQPVPFAYALCSTVLDAATNKPAYLICQQVNERFAELVGKPIEAVLEQPFGLEGFDLLAQVREEIPPQVFFISPITKRKFKVDVLYTAKDGDIWVIFVDITKQIQIDAHSIIATKDKTTEADEQFLRILLNSEDPMLLIENAVFIECNDAAARLLGYANKSDFLMKPPGAISPEFQPSGISTYRLAELMNAETIRKGYNRFECVHLKADGSPIPIEVSLTSIVYQGRSMLHCIWRDLAEQKRIEREMQEQQERLFNELSTPITQLWEGILLLPVVGTVSSIRAQTMLSAALSRIGGQQARALILDISGVSLVDTSVANAFLRLAKATRLMGCMTIISGISPAVAQTMVELGIDIDEVNTTATMQDALQRALLHTGATISSLR